jgi:hypothetical protein
MAGVGVGWKDVRGGENWELGGFLELELVRKTLISECWGVRGYCALDACKSTKLMYTYRTLDAASVIELLTPYASFGISTANCLSTSN